MARRRAGWLRELALEALGRVQDVLPSTTRTAAADGWRENGRRAVIERPIRMGELGDGALIYGNVLVGLVPELLAGRPGGSAAGLVRRASDRAAAVGVAAFSLTAVDGAGAGPRAIGS